MGDSILVKDNVTGVFTQDSFEHLLARKIALAEASAENIALLLVDPDVSQVIPALEPDVASVLLREVSLRLRGCLRANDVVAHFEDNQFAVILDEIENPDAPGRVARKIIQTLSVNYKIGEETWMLDCCVGIVSASPFEVNDVALVSRAQKALANAKAEGGNQFHYYIEFLDILAGR